MGIFILRGGRGVSLPIYLHSEDIGLVGRRGSEGEKEREGERERERGLEIEE